MIVCACTNCGIELKVKDEPTGNKIKCPGCGKPLIVLGTEENTHLEKDKTGAPSAADSPTLSADNRASISADVTRAFGSDGADSALWDFLAPAKEPDEIGRLGAYRVLQVLGAGGMGVVFKAEDPHLERIVALKAMLPALAKKPEAKQRFFREAKAAAALKHPNVVTIFQVGEDRGVPFLAMEFLEGEPLDVCLKRDHMLPVRETVRIGRQIAEGLATAHDKGLIHRDIKPANIWLESTGEGRGKCSEGHEPSGGWPLVPHPSSLTPHVKILDFGLARALADNVHLTQSGAVVGTPAYMAPEQARSEAVDHRGDLFSLGVVLYRMTTGRLPFRGDSTMAVLTSLAVDQPDVPRLLVGELPAELSDLIMQLLSKDPAQRPASARAVSDRLQRIDQQLGTSATDTDPRKTLPARVDRTPDRPTTDQPTQRIAIAQPARKAARKRLAVIAAALGILVLLVLGFVFFPRTPSDTVKDDKVIGDKVPPIAVAVDNDRNAAAWVLSLGGAISVTENGNERQIGAVGELPREAFELTVVTLHNNPKVSDAGLATFKDC